MPIDYRGRTALITGASSGLGAEFARQLASRGSDLVLVARRVDRLEALAAQLRSEHGIVATVIPSDLAKPRAGTALAAEVASRGIEVHTLVANAGFGARGRFAEQDGDRAADEVAVNVASVVDAVHAWFPRLLAHGDGALVVVASVAAFQPIPKMAVYGASKAFVLSFTEALWYEAKGSGLKVLAVGPGNTSTEFFDTAGAIPGAGASQTPEQVVRLALKTLDRRNPPPSIVSGAKNHLLAALTGLIPRRMLATFSGRLASSDER